MSYQSSAIAAVSCAIGAVITAGYYQMLGRRFRYAQDSGSEKELEEEGARAEEERCERCPGCPERYICGGVAVYRFVSFRFVSAPPDRSLIFSPLKPALGFLCLQEEPLRGSVQHLMADALLCWTRGVGATG